MLNWMQNSRRKFRPLDLNFYYRKCVTKIASWMTVCSQTIGLICNIPFSYLIIRTVKDITDILNNLTLFLVDREFGVLFVVFQPLGVKIQ